MPKIEFEFDPFDATNTDKPRRPSRDVLEEAAELIKIEMLSYIGEGKSPLAGGLWKRSLSPEYRKRKAGESSATFANLELSGDLLDSLTVEPTRAGTILISIPDDQADKAEGNLLGSYGRDPNPDNAREFMPHKDGDTFKRPILAKLRNLLDGED